MNWPLLLVLPVADLALGSADFGKSVTVAPSRLAAARSGKDLRDNGWFIFFAPRDNPEIAGVVFLEHGIHGPNAASVAHHVLETFFAKKDGKPLPPPPTHEEMHLSYKDPYARGGAPSPDVLYLGVKVFAIEGEGGLTTGATHETKNSAFSLGLDNLHYLIDWNDWGIDEVPASRIVHGDPRAWFEPYGFNVHGAVHSKNMHEAAAPEP